MQSVLLAARVVYITQFVALTPVRSSPTERMLLHKSVPGQ